MVIYWHNALGYSVGICRQMSCCWSNFGWCSRGCGYKPTDDLKPHGAVGRWGPQLVRYNSGNTGTSIRVVRCLGVARGVALNPLGLWKRSLSVVIYLSSFPKRVNLFRNPPSMPSGESIVFAEFLKQIQDVNCYEHLNTVQYGSITGMG